VAGKYELHFIETSAKTAINVERAFSELVRTVYDKE
jgi:GTPase SAR1 family protein